MNPSTASLISAWATEHWWLAFWLAFWLGAWAFLTAVAAVHLAQVLVVRPLRAIMVLARGWPPAHLDADGDWRPVPKAFDD